MSWARRSPEPEWMDDPAMPPTEMAAVLRDLAAVNVATSAHGPTLAFLRAAARGRRSLSVLDVGAGGGDTLRRVARWGRRRRRGLALRLDGVDLSPAATAAAVAATPPDLGVHFRTGDVFDEAPGSVDVIVSSLFTHHLPDPAVVRFLRWMERTATVGWFINDLHRHPVAAAGFAALSAAARWHPTVRHDGVLSVRRSFRRGDWERVLAEAGVDGAVVRWHWPFRLCVGKRHCATS